MEQLRAAVDRGLPDLRQQGGLLPQQDSGGPVVIERAG